MRERLALEIETEMKGNETEKDRHRLTLVIDRREIKEFS